MDIFLKITVVLLVFLLIVMQLLLISPISARIYADDYNGAPLAGYQTTLHQGFVTLNALGRYVADSATLMINGESVKAIDRFPVKISLTDGDVLEVEARKGSTPFYVYVSERSANLSTDQFESSIKVNPGLNRILSAIIR